MSIRWLATFFVLVGFVLVDSDQLPATYTENKQWTDDDSADYVNRSNGKSVASGLKPETQRIPIRLSHRGTVYNQHNTGKDMSSKKKDYQRMIAALSKIAKVQLAEEDSATVGRGLMPSVYDTAREKSAHLRNNGPAKDTGRSTLLDTPFKLPHSDIFDSTSSGKIKRGSFLCKATQDVYISDIKEKIPSYVCKSGGKTFVLSSKRFFQDRRSNMDVNIDDDTFRRLNDSTVAPKNGRFNVIPAILVLKHGHENYDVRNQ